MEEPEKMNRRHTILFALLGATLLLGGCFKKSSFETTYVLKPQVQPLSGDPTEGVTGALVYAFDADTSRYEVASYDDALKGVLTSRTNPSERITTPSAVGTPYGGTATASSTASATAGTATAGADLAGADPAGATRASDATESWLTMTLTHPTQVIVAVDPARRLYAVTQQAISETLSELYVTVVFKPWKEGTRYKDGKWMFYNDFYTPPTMLDCYVDARVEASEGSEPEAPTTVKVYAYAVDTTSWYVASYDDAVAGTITSKSDATQRRTNPNFQGYEESTTGLYRMTVSATPIMMVVVDRTNRMYAYTERRPDLTGPSPTYGVVFRPWQGVWIDVDAENDWVVVNPSHAPATGTAASTGTTTTTTTVRTATTGLTSAAANAATTAVRAE